MSSLVLSEELDLGDRIIYYLQNHKDIFKGFHGVYLFGSALDDKKTPADIDLLLVYSDVSGVTSNRLEGIREVIESVCDLPIDFTVLSINELNQTGFLNQILNYVRLK